MPTMPLPAPIAGHHHSGEQDPSVLPTVNAKELKSLKSRGERAQTSRVGGAMRIKTSAKRKPGSASTADRRTTGVQRTGRAAKVVASVLKATAEELNRVGYANLKVEAVAERAKVNKTSVYRRWPTKAILVSDTLDAHFQDERPLPDTGSLRDDFRSYLTNMVQSSSASIRRGVLSALAGRTDPEVEEIAQKLYARERAFRTSLVQRAIDRGEFPRGVDPELIGDMCSAPVLRRLLTFGEHVEAHYIDAVIDIALTGSAAAAVRQLGTGPAPDITENGR